MDEQEVFYVSLSSQKGISNFYLLFSSHCSVFLLVALGLELVIIIDDRSEDLRDGGNMPVRIIKQFLFGLALLGPVDDS